MKRLQTIMFLMATINSSLLYGDIIIRPAKLTDCNAIADLTHKAYNQTFKPLYATIPSITCSEQTLDDFINEKITKQNNATVEFITRQLNQEDYGFLVAYNITPEKTSQLAGFCRYNKKNAHNTHIYLLCVDKKFQRNGIGTQLLSNAINTFADTDTCTLRVLIGNEMAHSFYQKHGFKNIGTVALDPKTGAPSTDEIALPTHVDYRLVIQN